MAEKPEQRSETKIRTSNHPMPRKDQVEQPLQGDQVSGTDIAGDETNVRTRPGIGKPGIADHIPPQPDRRDG